MVISIARIHNYKITPQRASELVAAFGLGFLGRSLFQQLSKLGGLPGWLLSAAIASSTTVVMGYAAVRWFEQARTFSRGAQRKLTQGLTTTPAGDPQKSRKRKPGQKRLRERITKHWKARRCRKPLNASRQGSG